MTLQVLSLSQLTIWHSEKHISIIMTKANYIRYVPLSIEDDEKYDKAVEKADAIYSEMMHNICW